MTGDSLKRKLTRRGFLNSTVFLYLGTRLTGCGKGGHQAPDSASKPVPVVKSDASSVPIRKYHEAPILAEKVARGELPPVDERLPRIPYVRRVPSIGRYGGTLYDQAESQGGRFHLDGALIAGPQETDNDGRIIRPHLCDRVEFSRDYREYVFHIREGLKWSDGVDLTAEDVIWWWEHEQNNKSL